MNYQPRKGVVLVRVCGTFMLVPALAVSDECPGVMVISGIEAILWKQLEKGQSYENVLNLLSKLMMKSKDRAEKKLNQIIIKLCEKGYLIEVN